MFCERLRCTVHRSRRGIEVRNSPAETEMQQALRISVIVAHHVTTVPFSRLGTRALVQDCGYGRGKCLIGIQTIDELVFVEVIGDRLVRDVDELVTVLEIVDDDDVVITTLYEGTDEVAADEAGTAGHYVHGSVPQRDDASRPARDSTRHRNKGTWPPPFPARAGRPWGVNSTGTCPAWGTTTADRSAARRSGALRLPVSGSGRLCPLWLPLVVP